MNDEMDSELFNTKFCKSIIALFNRSQINGTVIYLINITNGSVF